MHPNRIKTLLGSVLYTMLPHPRGPLLMPLTVPRIIQSLQHYPHKPHSHVLARTPREAYLQSNSTTDS